MATGVASSSPETERVAVALDFPISDALSFSSPPRIPRRLRKRLLEARTPCTVEEIEAKLRHADLRRQQFYEKLSSKARPKPRSPSRSSSHDEDLGQRLEAKLQAAEQKRLDILAKAQMRLARLDELRQAAKSGAEMRFARERERLGMKVELRVQQAEANRMLILKANRQRRASQKERMSQSILRRMARESKYKERVRAAIHQKRTAAERKRMGLLEAEKKRACARVLQVRRVAKSVSHQREIERRRMRDHLENRLQRAKRQRAEYLRQRGRQQNSVRVNWNRMHKQADLLSRKLARCWRQFLRSRRTTLDLAKNYDALKIHESSVKPMPFEQLARLIESATTLQTVKALLDRLESRLRVSRAVGSNHSISLDNIDHLLKRVATPRKRVSTRNSVRSREAKKVGAVREAARSPAKSSRYPVRVVLCAYMILGHPDAVLSGQGDHGPIQSSDEESDSISPKRCTFRSQLATFDKAWCSYLNCFVVWKVKDAQSLEEDMVRAACQLELSMIQKCKLTPEGDSDALSHDMKAIQKQVTEDQKLLREKIQHLSGDAGIERMEHALSETRSKYFQAKEYGSPVGSPITHFLSPVTSSSLVGPSVGSSACTSDMVESVERPNRAKIRETMEAAFWDGVMESIKQDEPADRVVELVREVRDGISEMAPESWKQQIDEAIDLDILSQVLKSGTLDIDYLGKILEFAFSTLQKLSSPAHEEEMKVTYHKLLKELAETCETRVESSRSHALAMIKGVRFVLEHIQWLSSVRNCKDQEWEEHTNFLSALINHGSSSQEFLPSTTLRTGASFMLKTKGSGTAATSSASNTTGGQKPERNAMVKELICWLLTDLKSLCSLLVCRQTLMMEQVVADGADVEGILLTCTKQLLELLDNVDDVGIEQIVEIISGFSQGDRAADPEKLQSRKLVMARMLAKSLQAGDPVLKRSPMLFIWP
ncbi:hypothetical protein GH714_005049 [Hevea brasiliensis]|uniref:T-complex protein 11 n=1 Tax=Hevea brasiliensis TaxID=3981 RepID=A0A6A6KZ47_HEVBR|nr:hypothetical protein GH714_005049 [Hevea brasiliensis]